MEVTEKKNKNCCNTNVLKRIIAVVLITQLVLLVKYIDIFNFNIKTYHAPNYAFWKNKSGIKHTPPKVEYMPKLTWLDTNPIYSSFNISTPNRRKRVTILIIVSTAPRRFDRRQAIRETWWTQCKPRHNVIPECLFMTDRQEPTSQYYKNLTNENRIYGDMRFQQLDGGVQFGMRLLNHAVFAMKNYEFDYFIRIDDDQFLCLDKFLQELPRPMQSKLHWGWVHCIANIVRPEESIILLSKDLLETFLKQDPKKIKCHPLADQMVAEWTNDLNLNGIFRHDSRIHHHPPVRQTNLRTLNNVCDTKISIHGSYPDDIRHFWSRRGPEKTFQGTLINHSVPCQLKGKFNWKAFGSIWKYQPKLCIQNPKWDTSKLAPPGKSYTGRQNSKKKK